MTAFSDTPSRTWPRGRTAVLAVLVLAALVALPWGRSSRLSAERLFAKAATATDGVKLNWGSLVSLQRTEGTVTITRTDLNTGFEDSIPLNLQSLMAQASAQPIDTGQTTQSTSRSAPIQQRLDVEQRTTASDPRMPSREQQPAYESAQAFPYAMSDGGLSFAWAMDDSLFVTSVTTGAQPVRQALAVRSPAVSLAFAGNTLAVGYSNGQLELRDASSLKVLYEGDRGGNGTLRGFPGNSLLAAFSSDELLIFLTVVDSAAEGSAGLVVKRIRPRTFPGGIRAVAVSSSGQMAVGTSDGRIIATRAVPFSSVATTDTTLYGPGPVNAIAFSHLENDEETMLVGGPFRGIQVLTLGGDSTSLAADMVDTRFLETDSDVLAYATSDKIGVLRLIRKTVLNAFGWVSLAVGGVSLVGLLIGFSITRFARMLEVPAQVGEVVPHLESAEAPTPLPAPHPPPALIEACAAGECVLYAGAGLSAQAGLPTWQSFVRGLLDRAVSEQAITVEYGHVLAQGVREGQVDSVADAVVTELRRHGDLLERHLRETFLSSSVQLPRSHRILGRISFSAVLTTNFDDLLEKMLGRGPEAVTTPQDGERLLDMLSRRAFFLLKLYGALDRPASVMVAPAEFSAAVSRNLVFSQFMDRLFYSRTLFFLGASLEGIEAYLGALQFRGTVARQHFALVGVSGTAWRAKADLLARRYGITVLPYTVSATHADVPEFLEALARAVADHLPKTAARRAQSAVSRLRRVRLENVGPFDSLDLEVDPNWTVLLGDNGVGKSNILRAIGIALAGDDAAPYAGRIIKSGRSSATIRLFTDRTKDDAPYLTELRRRDDGGTELRRPAGGPMEAENWLAVGFPPLRTVTWERRVALDEGKPRPMPADVLPIIRTDPDPRLDRLKSWLVDLYTRRLEERSLGRPSTYGDLLDDFFEVINRVTPGISVGLREINLKTKEVIVDSDDGPIPIEAVSQGTTSLLGWVGVLMQRLYEVYEPAGSQVRSVPRGRYALVLIDEIDAHMHPAWQQAIGPTLREIFPETQFVVSTHSPLIVSELTQGKVWVLDRQADTKHVIVGPPDEDISGMRADQILTSSLFKLRRTRNTDTEVAIARYSELLGKSQRTTSEQQEFQELRSRLDQTLKVETTPAARLVEEAVRTTLATMTPPAGDQARAPLPEHVEVELKRQLTELLSPPDRPLPEASGPDRANS